MKRLLECKHKYNAIKESHGESKVKKEDRDELFEGLFIHDFSRKLLHTIFLFNDIAKSKLFKKAEGYFNQLIPIC